MGVVSEAAAPVVEKALASRSLRIKISIKKPVISACESSKQVPTRNGIEKTLSMENDSINASGNRKPNSSILGIKRKLGVECEKEKRLKMDRYTTSNCRVILGKMLKHRLALPFKKPVDPVKLHIPDYFDFIKKPMDLGTIRQKLDGNEYGSAEEFESDVRLTFSNALHYNPPENEVHQFAKELLTFFDHLWKPVKVKMNRQYENIKQKDSQNTGETTHDAERNFLGSPSHIIKFSGQIVPGEIVHEELVRGPVKKMKVNSRFENMKKLSSQKIGKTTPNVTQKCRKTLISHVGKLTGKTMSFCVKDPEALTTVSVRKEEQTDEHHQDKKLLSSHKNVGEMAHDAGKNRLKSPLYHVEKLPTQTTVQMGELKILKDLDVEGSISSKNTDTVGENTEIMCSRPGHSNVKVKCEIAKDSMHGRKASRKETKDVEVKNNSMPKLSRSDQDPVGDASCMDENKVCSTSGATTSSDATINRLEAEFDMQLSPSKALRAAMLKSRFADTILKAQNKTLLQSGHGPNSGKLQLEKERLERKQREEKAKIEAQIKAAESAARMKAESELKRRREEERIALEKMEQSVVLDDNFHVLKELEGLIGRPLFVLCKSRDGRSQAAYLWDKIKADELRSPLEQLGLVMKSEYLGGDDDDAVLPEEGEWEEGEVVF